MPSHFMKAAFAGLALTLAGCASLIAPSVKSDADALRPGAYSLDQGHAALLFRIDHLGYSDFIGRFERFDATLDFDADNPESASVSAVIDMTSLTLPDKDFAATLMGPNWFDAEAFPQASFTSTSVMLTGENTGTVAGDLVLHGVKQPVTLDVTFNGGARDMLRGGYVTGFSASGTIDRTAFGVSQYSGLLADEVTIEIEAEFLRSDD